MDSHRPTEPSSTPTAADLAKKRDGKCVLSGSKSNLQAVPIVPPILIEPATNSNKAQENRARTFAFLKRFWGRHQDKWEEKIERLASRPDDQALQCSNLICLTEEIGQAWVDAKFALKPLPPLEDEADPASSMCLQFFWQAYVESPPPLLSVTQPSPSTEGLEDFNGYRIFYNAGPGSEPVQLRSADIFTLRTEDPTRYPLPDHDLLELAWNMTRIVALQKTVVDSRSERLEDGLDEEEEEEEEVAEEDVNAPRFRAWFQLSVRLNPSPLILSFYDADQAVALGEINPFGGMAWKGLLTEGLLGEVCEERVAWTLGPD